MLKLVFDLRGIKNGTSLKFITGFRAFGYGDRMELSMCECIEAEQFSILCDRRGGGGAGGGVCSRCYTIYHNRLSMLYVLDAMACAAAYNLKQLLSLVRIVFPNNKVESFSFGFN